MKNKIFAALACHLIPVEEEEEVDVGTLVEHIDDPLSRGMVIKRITSPGPSAWSVLWTVPPCDTWRSQGRIFSRIS